MHEYPSLEMIAQHLDQTIPPETAAPLSLQPNDIGAGNSIEKSSEKSGPAGGTQLTVIAGTQAESTGSRTRASTASGSARLETLKATLPQHGIYSSSQFSNQLSASYNESITLRFTGVISVPKLTRALERLAERHEALRTSFDREGLFMNMASVLRIQVPITDFSMYGEQEREKRLNDLIAREMAKAFPLPAGPLFRAQIVLLTQDSAAVVISAHHAICDGWSLDVLIYDLCAFYSEELSGRPVPLPVPVSYFSFVQTLTERVASPEYEEARDYWHKTFAHGFLALALPTDRPRASRRDFSAERLDHVLPQHLVRDMRKLATHEGCSFFAVVLGGLSILLARVARQNRFVLSIPFADQPAMGQPGLVGHCVSLLPFLVELRDGESIASLLQRIQAQLAEIHDHALFNLLHLKQDLRCAVRGKGISPISVGLTNVRKFEAHELPQMGFSVSYDANPKRFESFEWYLNALESADGLTIRCHYGKGLFDRTTVSAWLVALEGIFADLVKNPIRETAELTGFCGDGSSSSQQVEYVLRSQKPADRISESQVSEDGFQHDSSSSVEALSRR